MRAEKRAIKSDKLIVLFLETETAKQNPKTFLPFKFSASRRGVWGEPQIKMIGNFWVLPRASLSSAAEAQVSFGQNPADFVRNTFELCSIHTASWEMKSLARPLRGLASRFSEKFQAVLNSVRPKRAFLEILYEFCYNSIVVSITQVMISKH